MEANEMLNYRNWVVVGDVLNPSKYAYKIINSLKEAGFNVEGINPREKSNEIYKSLRDVKYKIDVIDLCINPIMGLKVMEEAKELGIDKVLVQPGAESEEIINYCITSGIKLVKGCVLVELANSHNITTKK